MAQRSEDGVGKTSEMSTLLERALAGWTRSAISIQASGSERPHQQAGHTEAPEPAHHFVSKNLLHPKGRPHTDIPWGETERAWPFSHPGEIAIPGPLLRRVSRPLACALAQNALCHRAGSLNAEPRERVGCHQLRLPCGHRFGRRP